MACKWLDIEVSKDDADNRREAVIYVLRPQWRSTSVLEEKPQTGHVNQMLVYRQESDVDKKDAIVLRIFGDLLDLVDRDREVAAMQIAHHAGCFPQILAIFTNGVAYQYAHGRNLTSTQLSDPTVLRAVAKGMARLHTVNHNSVDVFDRKGERYKGFDKELTLVPRFFARLDRFPDKLPNPETEQRRQAELPPLSYFKDELRGLQTLMDELEFTQAPLCHIDAHAENTVYDAKTDAVTFVDLELACGGPVAFDLTYMFSLYILEYLNMPHLGGPIDDKLLRIWVKSYLEGRYEACGDGPCRIDEKELQLMILEAKIMDVYVHFILAVYGYIFLDSPNDSFRPFTHIDVSMKEYNKRKPTLQHLIEEYKKLKHQ